MATPDDDTRTGKENEKFGTFGNDVLLKVRSILNVNMAEERVENSSFKVIFQAWAPIGSSDDEAIWLISKLIYDSGGIFSERKWANGEDTFNKIWDDRATYNYSY